MGSAPTHSVKPTQKETQKKDTKKKKGGDTEVSISESDTENYSDIEGGAKKPKKIIKSKSVIAKSAEKRSKSDSESDHEKDPKEKKREVIQISDKKVKTHFTQYAD